jgi:putative SOS response-associated peptidase YedK
MCGRFTGTKPGEIYAEMFKARAGDLFVKPRYNIAPTFDVLACRRKQPYYIRMKAGNPFAFAGLWERWEPEGVEAVDSCTIIVTTANDLVSQIHDRMPVILTPQDYELWLDPEVHVPDKLTPLLKPYPEKEMEVYPVGFGVNSPKHEGEGLIQPL